MQKPISILVYAGLVLFVALLASTLSQAAVVDVSLTDSAIEPDTVFIAPGDTVRWTVTSGVHILHSDTDSYKSWDSGLLDTPGQTFELPFLYADGPGPFLYVDLGHGFWGAVLLADTCFATGTLNDSGPPSVADLVFVLRIIAGSGPVPDKLYRLDLTGDCIVNQADAEAIGNWFAFGPGIFPQYPVPTCCYPQLQVSCPIVLTGDVNLNGSLTAADIISLIMHVFKGGAPPAYCAAAGDVDCSGHLSVTDVIYLVSYLFRSGPPPCDVCTIIPDKWICP